MQRPAPFLPDPDHIAYLANLLTVLGILYAAWLIHRARAKRPTTAAGDTSYAYWGRT